MSKYKNIIHIKDYLKKKSKKLQNELDNYKLDTLEPLEYKSSFQELEFKSNHKSKKEIMIDIENLLKNKQDIYLNFIQADLLDYHIKIIAKALKSNKTLKYLTLYGNKITDEGAITIAKALEVNSTLKELNLGMNRRGVKGAKALAKALKVNSTLKELNLIGWL